MQVIPWDTVIQALEPLFGDSSWSATVTYKRYTGTQRTEAGAVIDTWDEFQVLALTGKRRKYSTAATGDVQVQMLNRSFIFKAAELPSGVMPKDLTRNDKIVMEGQTLDIKDLRYVDTIVWCQIEGG